MKNFIAALSATILLSAFSIPKSNQTPEGNEQTMYGRDGHYWTVYLVSTLLKNPNAQDLAFYAELPDDATDTSGCVIKNTNTFLKGPWQARIHALSGGDPEEERKKSFDQVRGATTLADKGLALHRLGDSFAHTRKSGKKMFPKGVGHFFAGHAPDIISNDTTKYINYVNTLTKALGGDDAKIDMTAFHYICQQGLSTESNSEILKSEIKLLNKVTSYTIRYKQRKALAKYLDYRKTKYGFTYSITKLKKKLHKNADAVVTITYN